MTILLRGSLLLGHLLRQGTTPSHIEIEIMCARAPQGIVSLLIVGPAWRAAPLTGAGYVIGTDALVLDGWNCHPRMNSFGH